MLSFAIENGTYRLTILNDIVIVELISGARNAAAFSTPTFPKTVSFVLGLFQYPFDAKL